MLQYLSAARAATSTAAAASNKHPYFACVLPRLQSCGSRAARPRLRATLSTAPFPYWPVLPAELRQQGSAPTLAGKPSKEVVGQLVRQVEEKHQASLRTLLWPATLARLPAVAANAIARHESANAAARTT